MQYLVVGSGRVALHFEFYLSHVGLNVRTWNRSKGEENLRELAASASHILLLIKDGAIKDFYETFRSLFVGKTLVHFSGSLSIPSVGCTHPLMTFGDQLYDPEFYPRISFVCTGADFSQVFPDLANPHYSLEPEQKAFYHSLCVLGGNFPMILWKKFFDGLEDLHIPTEAAHVYLQRILHNFLADRSGSLTGPLARKDFGTIVTNLKALQGDPFEKIYRDFAEVSLPDFKKEWHEHT